jgi:hypothetical protein
LGKKRFWWGIKRESDYKRWGFWRTQQGVRARTVRGSPESGETETSGTNAAIT